ncbi:MAG TPA: Uma2 family endonuclease [Polyangiaceae bacterium]|nr:Uma2 family endonuclease [Polyangiaceae bacterium]
MAIGGHQPLAGSGTGVTIGGLRYVRAPRPLHFPESEDVGESKLHLELCTLLYQLLKLAFADHASVGCDQFVYWDAKDPRANLAPDAFVRLGPPDEQFRTWKVWERGAPHVAVEVISHTDVGEKAWAIKLEKYERLGVQELVRFEPDARPPSLRVWDRVENDLVERDDVGRSAPSLVLPGHWLLVDDPELGAALRLSHDAQGEQLYPTPAEARRLEAEAQRLEAELRIRELEAELARRQG